MKVGVSEKLFSSKSNEFFINYALVAMALNFERSLHTFYRENSRHFFDFTKFHRLIGEKRGWGWEIFPWNTSYLHSLSKSALIVIQKRRSLSSASFLELTRHFVDFKNVGRFENEFKFSKNEIIWLKRIEINFETFLNFLVMM